MAGDDHKPPRPSRRTLFKVAGLAGAAVVGGASPFEAAARPSPAPAPQAAPQGAPNILLILLDDVGFADLGCYGSEIRTPAIDRLAAGGLRYLNFRTTGVCSASRAALLTGLNHHSAGIGRLTDDDRGVPGYRGDLTLHAATLAEVLRASNYMTYHVGKWHVNQAASTGETGPVYNWPLQRGFDRAYWFQGHSSDYLDPATLMDGNTPVERPDRDDYYLTDDLADRAIENIRAAHSLSPGRPWFLYAAFNAAHSPLQVRAADRDSYAGRYEAGWDAIRTERLARQKSLGLLPAAVELPPRNPDVRAWEALSPAERRVFARYMEVYAGVVQRADWNIGRILAAVDEMGIADDTIVILASDNGASAEGSPAGTPNILAIGANRPTLADAEALRPIMGERGTFPHYPTGWAMACNTPFKLYKQLPHLGGVADPLIVRWPRRIADAGGVRRRFVHIVDIYPTILKAIGIRPLESYGARELKRVEGTDFLDTFDPNAPVDVPRTQYFEINGHRALYADGWRIVTRHTPGQPFENDRWELYDAAVDLNEVHDLAVRFPDRVRHMVHLWEAAARRYNVLPLDNRSVLGKTFRARWEHVQSGRLELYPPIGRISPDIAPAVSGRDHAIIVDLERRSGDEDGVLVAYGSMYFGWVLYIQDGKLVYESSSIPKRERLVGDIDVPAGRLQVSYRETFSRRPFVGTGTLSIGDRVVAHADYTRALFGVAYQGLEIGRNGACQIGAHYRAPFPFAGNILKAVIEYDTSQWTDAELQQIIGGRNLPI